MKPSIKPLILCLGIGLFLLVLRANGGLIWGYVLDDYGDPVAGVSVYASDGLGDNYSTTTDGSGYYALGVVNGNFGVSLNCTQLNFLNYQCVATNDVSVFNNSIEADFNLQFIATPLYPFTILHGFSAVVANASAVYTNREGANPNGGLVLAGGMLYGTTADGGTNGAGTVFALSTNPSATNILVLHTFAAFATNRNGIQTNSDGANPFAGLILEGSTLYGTAANGGTNGNGTVFAINTNGSGFTVLHTFTSWIGTNSFGYFTNSDGANPNGGLVLSGATLYGSAESSGTNGSGTVFAVNINGTGFVVLHTFTSSGFSPYTNSDGANPMGGLILSGATLYGTAETGGTNGFGTVFELNTKGASFANLYTFTGGDDGGFPFAGLVLSGNILYGTASSSGSSGNGTVFAVNTNGTGFNVLHAFTGGDDGAAPYAGLILSGNTLYGAAEGGGSTFGGTLFAVSTSGTNFAVLHDFTGGDDGANPYANLVLEGNTLYGTASGGGSTGDGTVFAVSSTAQPTAPTISPLVHFVGGQFQMTVNGTAGQNYTVQMSTNLNTTNWISLLVTNSPISSFLFTDLKATNNESFYRVLVGP